MALTKPAPPSPEALKKRKKHFTRKRRYASQFGDADMERISQQLYDCEETEVLACCSHCGNSWYIKNLCRLRVCPLCSYRVSLERAKYMEMMCKHMKYPKMITLTMPRWSRDPREGIKLLRDAFTRLRKSKLFRACVGGAYNIELKPKENGWHIHMHVLVDMPFLPYQKLWSKWGELINHRTPQVDIRAAENEAARAYSFKYACKSADFDSFQGSVVEWYIATKGSRLFGTFGKWYNARIEDLDKEGTPDERLAVCPHCESENTTYLARDGPFIFGHDMWRSMRGMVTRNAPLIRDLTVVKEYMNKKPQPPTSKT